MSAWRRTGAGLFAAAAVAGSYAAVRSGAACRVDESARALAERSHAPRVDEFVAGATDLGSLYGLTGVATALAAGGRWRVATDVAVSGLAAWSVAQGIKPLLIRDRPYEQGTAERLVSPPAGTSWPSGHAAVAAAMVGALWTRMPPAARRTAALTAAAVGVSRVHVGVHHFSDVVAGWGIGSLCASMWRLLRRAGAGPGPERIG